MITMTRREAAKKANRLRRYAQKAWEQDWDQQAESFWNKTAERLALEHGLQLRTYTCAGIPIATQYV